MAVKRSGLGRNLTALLGNNALPLEEKKLSTDSLKLAIDCLQPGKYQPRTNIEEGPLDELALSIKQQGLLQPLLVRELPESGRYEIIAGERRWRACQLAGLTEVSVIRRQVDDETAMALALVENLQREDLNAIDQARAMQRLTSEFGLTHHEVAEMLCKSRTAISNYLRLLKLAQEVIKLVEQGNLNLGHARPLLMLEPAQQLQVATLIIAKNLSVRETEKLVNRVKNGQPEPKEKPLVNIRISEQLQALVQQWQTKIKHKPGKEGKGSLVIHYDSEQILQRLIEQLIVEPV